MLLHSSLICLLSDTYEVSTFSVFSDLKPQNLGFIEDDTIQLFDFGLCRELPKPKGQAHRDENLEDEEDFDVFLMSGVGTQRYMAPEILNTRRYVSRDTHSELACKESLHN